MKQVIIREVISSDAVVLVELSHQLGYSISLADMQANIELCLNDKHYKILLLSLSVKSVGLLGLLLHATTLQW